VYPSDFNGDGREDLPLYSAATGMWFQARNLSTGTFDYVSGFWERGLTIVARRP
jgi:hypothetical protein